jgi:hypothetical protein
VIELQQLPMLLTIRVCAYNSDVIVLMAIHRKFNNANNRTRTEGHAEAHKATLY